MHQELEITMLLKQLTEMKLNHLSITSYVRAQKIKIQFNIKIVMSSQVKIEGQLTQISEI
jgi:hypothetical protein